MPSTQRAGDGAGGSGGAPTGQIPRAVAILEAVATRGASTAKEIAEATGIPLPSVYRLCGELIAVDYLVHLRDEARFALGYQLHKLGVGLHRDIGMPPAARREVRSLQEDIGMATYLAIHRGTEFVVVFVASSPACPPLEPMGFGFHDHPYATAFGKLGLSDLDPTGRREYLAGTRLVPLTPSTLTDPAELDAHLDRIAASGVAWEFGEFQEGTDCLAVPLRAGDGTLVGSVATSGPARAYAGRHRHLEDRVRACATRVARLYRTGR